MTKPKPKTAAEALRQLKGKRTLRALQGDIRDMSGRTFNVGYLQQIMAGKRRASNALLYALRLPLNAVPAQPCNKCGRLHDFVKLCPDKRKPHSPYRAWRNLIDLKPGEVAWLIKTRKEYKP